jgi:hypothetical protein
MAKNFEKLIFGGLHEKLTRPAHDTSARTAYKTLLSAFLLFLRGSLLRNYLTTVVVYGVIA